MSEHGFHKTEDDRRKKKKERLDNGSRAWKHFPETNFQDTEKVSRIAEGNISTSLKFPVELMHTFKNT